MFQIQTRSNQPIYEQIIDSIKENVVRGFLHSGDELPSVRKMAMQLSVTPNTVAKAYRELERERVIEVIRGKGTYISSEYKPKRDEDKMREIEEALTREIVELTYMGVAREEVLEMIEKIYDQGLQRPEK